MSGPCLVWRIEGGSGFDMVLYLAHSMYRLDLNRDWIEEVLTELERDRSEREDQYSIDLQTGDIDLTTKYIGLIY